MPQKSTKQSLLNSLQDRETWQVFYEYKKEKARLTKQEETDLKDFVENKKYKTIAAKINRHGFCFDNPEIKIVNKAGTSKKRIVYCYKQDEVFILKLLVNLLYKYDHHFSPNCFSFRKDFGVRRAVNNLLQQINGKKLFCYKLDIKNYFNSIDVNLLLPQLKALFTDDDMLYNFFEKMLTWESGHGVMAGTPTSPFLSNVYITDLDKYFFDAGVPYARYSDDVIVFANSFEKLEEHKTYIKSFLNKMNLVVNENKEQTIEPGEPWSFLGIEYNNGHVDLSPVTIDKIKAKIRRKARAILRWKNKKGAPDDKALKVMIRVFNKKFFESANVGDLTWSRWFFPLLTTDKGLHEVDNYLQMQLRYLATGKHNKTNFSKVSYEALKNEGYISLVNRFHKGAEKKE